MPHVMTMFLHDECRLRLLARQSLIHDVPRSRCALTGNVADMMNDDKFTPPDECAALAELSERKWAYARKVGLVALVIVPAGVCAQRMSCGARLNI